MNAREADGKKAVGAASENGGQLEGRRGEDGGEGWMDGRTDLLGWPNALTVECGVRKLTLERGGAHCMILTHACMAGGGGF